MERIPVTDYTLFYEVVDGNIVRYMEPVLVSAELRPGSGRPLILLHSLTGGAATLEPLSKALSGRRPLIVADLRGFGSAHRPTLSYTADTWADDVAALLPALGVEPGGADVYGHGFGACAATALLERKLVGSAIISGVAFGSGEPALLGQLADEADLGAPVEADLARLTGGHVVAADITPQAFARVVRGWQEYSGPASGGSLGDRLRVLAGADDTFTPAHAAGGAAALVAATGAGLITLPGGHDLPGARPAELADAICSFLDEKR